MKHNLTGKYGKITLIPLEESHIEEMRVLRNKNKDFFVYSGVISESDQKSWYNKYLLTEGDFAFSVMLEDTWIGSVSIYNVDTENQTAEFGRLLVDRDKANQKGLGVDTTICACNIAFAQLNINKITLQVYDDNIAAYKTYLKSGFTEVGFSFDKNGKKLIDMILKK